MRELLEDLVERCALILLLPLDSGRDGRDLALELFASLRLFDDRPSADLRRLLDAGLRNGNVSTPEVRQT